ncbi:MAG: hypothetical protein KGL39_11605 [Patescibacteria group bacterium]|nr:hypothetical protein [Patescibacteria group bacterium]
MTIYNERGDSRFSKLWVSKNGLVEKQPEPKDRMSHEDATIMADAILDLLGMGEII